jgi:hypothetical protein
LSDAPPDHSFLQYFYQAHEFRRHVVDCGFEVVAEQPYSLWRGLTDLGPFRWLDDRYAGRSRRGDAPTFRPGGERTSTTGGRGSPLKDRVKYWVFSEDRNIPIFGTLLALGCETAANMRMYVCRRQ